MGIIVNQSIKNSVISYVGIAIGFITTIKLFPNILDSEQFGLTRVMVAIVTLSTQFVNLGIPNSIVKFFPELSGRTHKPSSLFFAFSLPPLLGVILFGITAFLFKEPILNYYAEDSSLLTTYFFYLIPFVFFLSFFSILTAFVKAYFNTIYASFLKDVLLRVIVIIDLLLFFFGYIDFTLFIAIFVLNYGAQCLLILIYALKKGFISFSFPKNVFNKELIHEISIYGFFSFFSGLTMVFVGNIDLLMVSTLKGLEQTGVYAIALYVGSVISIPKKSIAKISLPILANSFQKNDQKNIESIYKKSSTNQFLGGLLIYIGVIANIDNLYSMLPKEYEAGGIIIVVIGMANLFDMITGANGQIIISSKYYRFDFYSSIILVISSVLLNIVLIPQFGLLGAAIATSISIFIYNSAKLVYVWVKLKIHPFQSKLFILILIGVLTFIIASFSPSLKNTYADIFVRSISISVVYLSAVYFLKVSDEINTIIFSLTKRVYDIFR